VVNDQIKISGDVEDGSVVQLTLFKSQNGHDKQPLGGDQELCSIKFTVTAADLRNNGGIYNTSSFLKDGGYVAAGYGSGRCYASASGFYYWYEEFNRPPHPSTPDTPGPPYHPPVPGGPGEEVDLKKNPPAVETSADPVAQVGQPFSDIAHVTLPKGDEGTYYLYFEAYGPVPDGTISCSNLIFSTINQKIKVNESGSYQSPPTSATAPGTVWWIERLVDEDGKVVAEGHCGAKNEITRVNQHTPPGPPASYDFPPFVPSAGFITRQTIKIILLGAVISFGAWQLTSKKSWLFKRR
jgi:hypothetical protein